MFMRFNDDARGVVVAAQKEAVQAGAHFIEVEHLRLAIDDIAEGRTLPNVSAKEHLPFTVEAKKALEQTLRAALATEATEITLDHLRTAVGA